jgi:hypothetical protein
MTVLFSPFGNSQFVDNNGVPAQGYTITTYAAGSSSLLATYTDATGASSNANPATLNAAGRNPSGQFWLTSGLSYKFVLKDAGGVVVQTVDGITGTNDPTTIASADQWVSYSGTPVYISATSFSVSGDQTTAFHANRRVKTTNTAGTRYSYITAAAFSAGITTVTVANDSGTLDSGLSGVSYGLLSYTNPSLPGLLAVKAASGYQKFPSGMILQWGSTTMSATGVATNFPIPFPTACSSVSPAHNGTGPTAVGGISYTATTSAVTLYSEGTGPFIVTYMAIGY